jgi:hypothetical protein
MTAPAEYWPADTRTQMTVAPQAVVGSYQPGEPELIDDHRHPKLNTNQV